MSKLPKKYNPFLKSEIYKTLKINPSTPTAELKKAIEKFSPKSLKIEEEADIDVIKKSLTLLKQPFTRVTLNALILEKEQLKTIKDHLKELPKFKKDGVHLPKPGLSQIHIEGQSIEIAEKDFNPISKESSLELNFTEVKDHVTRLKPNERYYFET